MTVLQCFYVSLLTISMDTKKYTNGSSKGKKDIQGLFLFDGNVCKKQKGGWGSPFDVMSNWLNE